MKIGFVLDDSLDSSDGVQQYILTLGKWFLAQGHQVHYLVGQTNRSDIANIHTLSRNISVRFNGNRMSIPLPANKKQIVELLKTEQFDVLHVQMPYSPFLAAQIIKQAAKVSPKTALVGTFHILPFGRLQRLAAHLLMNWLKSPNKKLQQVWSVSKPAADFAASLGINSTVLPNAISLNDFKTPSIDNGDKFRVVFLGRLVERKGCAELLRAIKLLGNTTRLNVIIGGKGPQLEQLQKQVEADGLKNIVEFRGYVSEADKPKFLAAADLAIFPSISGESFGIVLLEAMAAGSGVVLAGNNPGYNSVMGSLPQSLFDPKDATALAEKITSLRQHARQFYELNQAQQKLVKQYDVAIVGKKLLSCYQQLITKR